MVLMQKLKFGTSCGLVPKTRSCVAEVYSLCTQISSVTTTNYLMLIFPLIKEIYKDIFLHMPFDIRLLIFATTSHYLSKLKKSHDFNVSLFVFFVLL